MSRFLASSNTAGNIVHSPEKDTHPIVNLEHIRHRLLCFVSLFPHFLRIFLLRLQCWRFLIIAVSLCQVKTKLSSSRSSRLLWSPVTFQTSTILGNRRFNSYFEWSTSNRDRTEWSEIRGVIGRVISNWKLWARLLPELYYTKSYYQHKRASSTQCREQRFKLADGCETVYGK